MKELTIEEKVKAYDKAIEIAKEINNEQRAQPFNVMTKVFPELAESEDDRIRKEIILALKFANVKGVYNKHISWLEKQGEHAKFRDSIQVGDKVTRNKDGVLVNLSQLNRVAKKDEKQGEQKPAFEMKTPEESLGVDSDTYNKIVDECVYGEQKPATWSEEDELRMENILSVIEGHGYPMEVKWLKSIKGRHTWKPSDEQTEALDGICSYIRNKADWEISQDTIHQLYSLSEQLKKLKG